MRPSDMVEMEWNDSSIPLWVCGGPVDCAGSLDDIKDLIQRESNRGFLLRFALSASIRVGQRERWWSASWGISNGLRIELHPSAG
mmetsp:Transcript_7547/g.15356  ORF Transcript_7547/g.15356 Transcript_7547/m.15356 type:complete len:85 (-) Transcript_7547:2316-2570(-)